MSLTTKEHLLTLSNRELRALNEAVTVLWLGDRSDYINGLWGVVDTLLGDSFNEEIDIDELRGMIGDAL